MSESLPAGLLEALHLREYVAVDLETTGLDSRRDEIIEIGVVRFTDGRPAERLSHFVKPRAPIPDHITRITGIRDADVRNAPPFAALLEELRAFVGDRPLVAHNADFDLSFLEHHARRVHDNFEGWDGRERDYAYFPNPRLDTVLLARIYLPFLPSFSLAALTGHFEIEREAAHRALPDAEAAGELFARLLSIAVRTRFEDVQRMLDILEPTDAPIRFFFEHLAKTIASGHFSIPEGIDRTLFDIHANHYNIIGERHRDEVLEEEHNPLDTDEIRAFFGPGGALAERFGVFESRLPQVDMAGAIARAFNQRAMLAVEAGTGTGKSLAYLVPAIRWAQQNGGSAGRVVISTNTKNLQEQLFFKDLPILHSIFDEPFKAVLLKGKGNYLCLDKWATVFGDMSTRLTPRERERVLPLLLWAQQTETGDISENHGFRADRNAGLWSKFIAENNYCPGKSCKFYDRCFLMRARNNARGAHLVLVNHSLLFSDLAADNAILGEYENLIVDEAHNIEKTATEYLGVKISIWDFRAFFNKLFQGGRRATGILPSLQKRIMGGKLSQVQYDSIHRQAEDLKGRIDPARKQMELFFRELTGLLRRDAGGQQGAYTTRKRYQTGVGFFDALDEPYQALKDDLAAIRKGLSELVDYLRDIDEERFDQQRQHFQDLNAQLMQVEMLGTALEFLLTSEREDYVYWYEVSARGDEDSQLYSAPLNIGSTLNETLYSRLRTGIFTSATLAVNQRFDYFLKRVGLAHLPPERVDTLLLDSPFDYRDQVQLIVPSFLSDPADHRFTDQVRALVEELSVRLRRGSLVLFTSYQMLNTVYQGLREPFTAERIGLLGQGLDGTRHAIINRFKTEPESVLLGTDSFWEGVDVPGSALEMVMMTKLPFDVPSDPIVQARSELIKREGGNPFLDYAVPEAVIRFRQGFGRLIRNRSDYGVVLVLDTRIIKKFYGRVFLDSLPVPARLAGDAGELFAALDDWFAGLQR